MGACTQEVARCRGAHLPVIFALKSVVSRKPLSPGYRARMTSSMDMGRRQEKAVTIFRERIGVKCSVRRERRGTNDEMKDKRFNF